MMRGRIESLYALLSQNYLFIGSDDTDGQRHLFFKLHSAILFLRDLFSEEKEVSESNYQIKLQNIRACLNDIDDGPDVILKEFIEIIDECVFDRECHFGVAAKEDEVKRIVKTEEEKHELFQRLNVIDAYRRLEIRSSEKKFNEEKALGEVKAHLLELKSEDAKVVLDEYLAQENSSVTTARITLRRGIALTWHAISSLPTAQKKEDAKKRLVTYLSQTPDVLNSENFYRLLPVIAGEHYDAPLLNNVEDIEKHVNQIAHVRMKEHLHEIEVKDQVDLYEQLSDAKDMQMDAKLRAGARKALLRDLALFDLVPKVDVAKVIDDELEKYLETKEARQKLQRQIKKHWIKQIQDEKRASAERLFLLRHCLSLEKSDDGLPARKESIEALKKAADACDAKKADEVKELTDSYAKLFEVDRCIKKLFPIKEELDRSDRKRTFGRLEAEVSSLKDSIHGFYKDIGKAKERLTLAKKCKEDLQTLRDSSSKLTKKIANFDRDAKKIYLAKGFQYRDSYGNLVKCAGRNILDKVIAVFNDYADGRWRIFHVGLPCSLFGFTGRTHTAEAREVIRTIRSDEIMRSGDPLIAAREYIKDVLHSIDADGELNLTGSFARRAHYCLKLLNEQITARGVDEEKDKAIEAKAPLAVLR
jgi:hypothetical protein